DLKRAKKVIAEELSSLSADKIEHAEVRIGAMIEIPSAVLTAQKIAVEVNFFELGTNDLVQYTLAVDRGNDKVSDWFRTLHPAVLYGINRTIQAAREPNIPVIVCGEMASTPVYAALLVGMGAVDLSMTPAMIPRVREVLSKLDVNQMRRLAMTCLA